MSEDLKDEKQTPNSPDEEGYGFSADLFHAVEDALEESRVAEVEDLVEGLHEADTADLLESLGREERQLLMEIMGAGFDPEILPYLDETVREEIVEWLGPAGFAKLVQALDSDDAVELVQELDEDMRIHILAALPQAYRRVIEESLSYPEDSAGRLMQREIVAVPSVWTVGETIDYMRVTDSLPDDFYDIYIVDPRHHPVGFIPASRMMRSVRSVRLDRIMEEDMRVIPLDLDQEDVAHMFRQYDLISAPVVEKSGRLVGVITIDDVVDVIDEEAGDDLMKMGGVNEADFYDDVADTTKSRFTWLAVNLVTAVMASAVIGLFDATIEKVVALAVLMPIVASMGGNAGTQTLTVAVRSLAMKNLSEINASRFISKELIIGFINGGLFALLTGSVAWFWFGQPDLALVIAAAMIINMVVAGLCGALIPLGLEHFKIDPAVASSVFLTTVTDIIGFFAFLGLATFFLL
ncbi:magnesium transporter [Kiloniella laminariae]|uniref:magnesium transporter n=1 Tax=Kiloniella laminariae TaxID=454162 RepID=UPI00037C8B3C|nr:magnesium transporter [Kiloniella laminariae]